MCGICGIINFNQQPVQEEKIRKMMKRMEHRGPDDDGVFFEDNVGLGFVRLSILDLSAAGHQPMFSNDNGRMGQSDNESGSENRYVIVYNGEVYNYIEIREELKSKGYVFKSNSDTEVVLNSYIEWGEDCLHKFNGMWAFCIFDRKEKELFFARDRYGVKPFYYYIDKNKFIFASEIPPIIEILEHKPQPDNQAIFDYLVFNRTDQTEDTFFEGIKKLQHGHFIKFRISFPIPIHSGQNFFSDPDSLGTEFKIIRWYDLRKRVTKLQGDSPQRMSRFQCDKKIFEEYRELLSSAVGLRLRSDVPVGVCLSGGLDSSSIVSLLLKDYKKNDLNTFSAVYGMGEKSDESKFIDLYKDFLKNMYFTSPDAETLLKDIGDFVKSHGEPVPSASPYAQFKVMELAKGNVVVTLDGQGADEQLAGYHYFYGFLFKDLMKNLSLFKFGKEIFYYLKTHKSLYGFKTFLYFLIPQKYKSELRINEKGYLNSEFVSAYSGNNNITGNIYSSKSLNDALLDHFEYKLEHLLKWEDRNSMWFSLESRVPFLDYRLVEFTHSLPASYKIQNGITKYVLRESMRNILPEKIRIRKDKIGFDTPSKDWFKRPAVKSIVTKIINEGHFFNNSVLNKDAATELYNCHLSGKKDINKEIWKWINLNLWYEEFIQ